MEWNSNSLSSRFLIKIFVARNTLPPFLQIIQTCIESVLYIAIINGFPLGTHLFNPNSANIVICLILMGLLLVRLLNGMSLIRFVYIPILSYALSPINASSSIIIILVIGLFVIMDIISCISFDFYSENLSSESLNICKILHYTALILGLSQTVLGNNVIMDGVCSGIFLGVWLIKRASICRSKIYKQFLLLVYLWMAVSHLMVAINYWFALPLLVQLGLPLALTQLVLRIYLQKKGQSKLDELYSQQNYLKMAFDLMIYIKGEKFNPEMDRQIEAFLADNQYSSLKDSEKQKLIYEKLIEILSRRTSYHEQLISSQIFLFYNHQLLRAKLLLSKIGLQVGVCSWMRRICVFRVSQTLHEVYSHKNKEIHFSNYAEYYRCDDFRTLMLKSSIAFVTMWQYTKRPEIVSQKLRELSDRLVSIQRRLKRQFTEIDPKCLTISLLYVSYLLEVARDSTQANTILESLAFNEDFQINMQLDQKIFVAFALEGEPMAFQKVGYNVSTLLGYEKRELEGQRIDILLPQFYRKFHSNYVNQCFQHEFSSLYLYSKKTIARNRWGYYEQCNAMLRLHFTSEGKLVLRGYLQIKPNSNYSWTHFLFIAENEEIIECSQSLSDYAPTLSRLHKAGQLFQDVKLYKSLVQKTADSLIEYHPLLVFQTEAQRVFFYVRLSKEEGSIEPKEKVTELLETMQLRKFDWDFVKRYYNMVQDLFSNIYAKQYILLALIALLSLGGLLACEAYMLEDAQNEAVSEQNLMFTTRQILSYYDSSIALGMRIDYVGLKLGYGYANTISTNNALNLSLVLQGNNELLKGFTKNTYSLPSLIPGVTYSKPNYDMIVELLSNAYMIRQFSDDLFLQSTVLSRAQLSLYSIFAFSLGEYEVNFVQSIKNIDVKTSDYVVIACILVMLVGLCVIIVRVDHRLRRDEQQALTIIANVHNQDELIMTTRQFISKITRQDTSTNSFSYEQENRNKNAIFNSSFTPDLKDASISRSEMSLREISGRDLLGDSFNNRSGVLQTVITSRLEPQPQSFSSHSQEITFTPRKRWMLAIAIGVGLTIGGVSLANQVLYNVNGQINLYQSINNIFTLFSTGSIFSRSMILFLNLINLRASGPISTTEFDAFMSNYTQSQVLVTFPQGTFPEFQPFQNILSSVTYQYMCTYVSCDNNFASQVNIIYTTTIQKIIAAAQSWKAQLNTMNVSAVQNAVKNGSLTHFIDLIYYSELTIRAVLLNTTYLYFDCFGQYSNNLKIKKQIMTGITLAVTALTFLFLIFLIWYVIRHQGYLRDIVGLIKTDSYINDDHQIADKQARNDH